MELLNKLMNRKITLAVVGIGRVGLPVSVVFASKGLRVIGIDVNSEYVEQVKKGEIAFHDPGVRELLIQMLKKGNFSVATDFRQTNAAEAIVVTVGTPLTLDFRPDLAHLSRALESICEQKIEGKLIIIRSTIPPGTTEGMICPLLENRTGLKCGENFYLAYCPERIMEGKSIEELRELPEIVGGINDTSSKLAASLFKIINPDKRMIITSPRVAELAKLFTNIYRYVNFALSNQFALIAEHFGVDAYEAIKVANDGYKRANIPSPGPSGGPCLYKDGHMISYTPFIDFIKSAWHLNESIPYHIVNRIKNETGGIFGRKVALLGLAYKADIDDTRHSPAVKLVRILEAEGCRVEVHDPHVKSGPLESTLRDADVVILAVNHSKFRKLKPRIISKYVKRNALFMDCWGMFDPSEIRSAGMKYVGLGR